MNRIVTVGLLVALFLMSGAILHESRSYERGVIARRGWRGHDNICVASTALAGTQPQAA
jgi:hypothetical protein